LVLKDGSVFRGRGFGADRKVSGEVVFNTGMVGYPESLTDPSYWGQILVQTYPLIGNYGIDPAVFESGGPKVTGYAVSSLCRTPSHHSSSRSLDDWLAEHGIPGIEGLDTRALTKRLRESGSMLGVLEVSEEPDVEALKDEARKARDPNSRDLTSEVTCKSVREHGSGNTRIGLIDCGTKMNIIRSLEKLGAGVVSFPVGTGFDEMMSHGIQGIMISNGPGDPKKCPAINVARDCMDQGLPVMGVCMGNQILGLAAGADTYKLKFGHRSQNQPCIEAGTGRCHITSQNHGFAIDSSTLPDGWEEWFRNVNDGSNEGIRHKKKPFMSVQFHPEASPGPVDTAHLFERFMKTLKTTKK
jgi:carbamoyl-phosphate synthase small subunit